MKSNIIPLTRGMGYPDFFTVIQASYDGGKLFSQSFVIFASFIYLIEYKSKKKWQPDGVFGYPFSDERIDGERYTVTVSEVVQTPLIHQIERLPRKIKLYAISKSYFEYMVSVLSMDYDESAMKGNLLSWGLLEPDKIYSNIEGATGIMGCYNLTTSRVDLLKFTGGWPTK